MITWSTFPGGAETLMESQRRRLGWRSPGDTRTGPCDTGENFLILKILFPKIDKFSFRIKFIIPGYGIPPIYEKDFQIRIEYNIDGEILQCSLSGKGLYTIS